jgi:phage gpG-like protein
MGPSNDGKRPGQATDSILRISGETITIGTKMAYARMMNDGTTRMPGGVLRPVHAKALKIPLPSGQKATDTAKTLRKGAAKGEKNERFIFRKSVKIPARPFDNWTEEDEVELKVAVENRLKEIFDGI